MPRILKENVSVGEIEEYEALQGNEGMLDRGSTAAKLILALFAMVIVFVLSEPDSHTRQN
jgi:hypothetical protein